MLQIGCATTDQTNQFIYSRKGVTHKVKKGETLWRIAKTYNVGIDEIIKYNRLVNSSVLKENQRLFIPGAEQIQEIIFDVDDPNKDEFVWPVKGKILNYYGQRKWGYLTKGISIQVQRGESIKASREGKVVFADYLSGYAMTVVLDHYDGYYSVYSQNAKLLVNLGDNIRKSDNIAQASGHDGSSYLYFQISRKGILDNPLYYLPKL